MAATFPKLIRTFTNLLGWRREGGQYWYVLASSADTFKEADVMEAFETIPEVYAPIALKARSYANMRLKEVDADGNEKKTTEGQRIINLISNPNWFQGDKEFLIQTKIFREVYGNEYIYKLLPFGMGNGNVKALFTIPHDIIKCKYDAELPFYLHSEPPKVFYKILKADNEYDKVEGENIIHFNDNRTKIKNSTDDKILVGQSKYMAMSAVINNLKMAYESRGIILAHRGANGAWVNDSKDISGSIELPKEERQRLERAFSKYGTLKGQKQTIVTSQNLRWEQAGTNNPQNLGIFEETREGFFKICDAAGVPKDVFASISGATFENQKQAEKGLYVRTIMPEANEWIGGIDYDLRGKDRQTRIIADYFYLPIFEDDLKTKSEAKRTAITNLSLLLQDKQITQSEYRFELQKLGFGDGKEIPPPADDNQSDVETLAAQAQLRGSVGGVQGILNIQASVAAGTSTRESALGILTVVYGFTPEQASEILGQPSQQNQQ
jgi:hypothetical protein